MLDIKLIRYNATNVDEPDDPSYPWRLDVSLSPPEFMKVAFLLLFGNEEICVRGGTKEALEEFANLNNLPGHPRLLSFRIWQPVAEEGR